MAMEDPQLARSGHAAAAPPMPPLPQYMNEDGTVVGAVEVELLTAGFMDAAAAAMSASDAMTLASTLDEDGVGSSQLALC